MKDFDEAAAMRGATVCTREGNPVRILCFDLKDPDWPIIAAYRVYGLENVDFYANDGRRAKLSESDIDLMMADDDYMEKLERGEYDHIEDNLEMVGKPDHIGKSTEKVDWEYWRRMYAGMALQGLVASDKWRRMEMGDRVCVCVDMAYALVDELKRTQK